MAKGTSKERAKAATAARATLEERIVTGELGVADVFEIHMHEIGERTARETAEKAHARKGKDGKPLAPKPEKRSVDVLPVAGQMTLKRVLGALPGLGGNEVDLLLSTYGLKPEMQIDECGSAEAFMLDTAATLVRHVPKS